MGKKAKTIDHGLVRLISRQLRDVDPFKTQDLWNLQLFQLFRGIFHTNLEQWVISSCFGQDLLEGYCDFQFGGGVDQAVAQKWLNTKVRLNQAVTFTKLLSSPNVMLGKQPLVLPSVFYKLTGKCGNTSSAGLKGINIDKVLEAIASNMPDTPISEVDLEEIYNKLKHKDVITQEMRDQLNNEFTRVRGVPLAEGELDIHKLLPVFMAQHQVTTSCKGSDYWLYVPCGIADQYPHFFALFCLSEEPTEEACDMVQRILDSTLSNRLIKELVKRGRDAERHESMALASRKLGHDLHIDVFNAREFECNPNPLHIDRIYSLLFMFEQISAKGENKTIKMVHPFDALCHAFLTSATGFQFPCIVFEHNAENFIFSAGETFPIIQKNQFKIDVGDFGACRIKKNVVEPVHFQEHQRTSYKLSRWINAAMPAPSFDVPAGLQSVFDPIFHNIFEHNSRSATSSKKSSPPPPVKIKIESEKITISNVIKSKLSIGEARGLKYNAQAARLLGFDMFWKHENGEFIVVLVSRKGVNQGRTS